MVDFSLGLELYALKYCYYFITYLKMLSTFQLVQRYMIGLYANNSFYRELKH
jgi:hypothetical protein